MATYAVRGTYSDGEVRHEHVHVADAKACLVYLGQKTEGFLPFTRLVAVKCDAGFTGCDHDFDADDPTKLVVVKLSDHAYNCACAACYAEGTGAWIKLFGNVE